MLKIKDRKTWAATWASMWMKFDYPTLLPTLNTTSAPLSLPSPPGEIHKTGNKKALWNQIGGLFL